MDHSRGAKEGVCRVPGETCGDRQVDVAVLGAGVVGMCTAYALARRGLSVVLIDRDEGPGRGTSFANGAQLSYAYVDALAQPALWRKIPAMLAGLDPAFRISLQPDMEFLRWNLAFLRNCTANRFREATRAALQLGLESQIAMAQLRAHHAFDFGHATPGKLHIYRDTAALARAEEVSLLKQEAGFEQHVVSSAEARNIEPALSGAEDFAGALWTPAEEVGDPHRFCEGLLAAMRCEYRVAAHFNWTLGSFAETDDGITVTEKEGGTGRELRARQAVICLGPEAGPFLSGLGIRVPIQPMKGYSFTAPATAGAPRVSLTDTARKIVFCRLGESLRVAGLAELGQWDRWVNPDRLHALIHGARAFLPEAARFDQAGEGWAGLRPMTPDSQPIVRRASRRIILNIGHGMLGWTFAAGTGERVAGLLTAGDICPPYKGLFKACPR
ncbi:FAD-dependent oxidoreductase [Altererythrobacter indicus]|uniref:FAD-dependent oxidoreductase n=1 Tax=Altericroceibacterium indicum TaxID=374177 RepID=A0A845A6S0_9SPHN|nr:FAD-dependent oxidoreductase [Altericroceibacterium indicum]MXP24731.1 FAD-dependent oxidoreductase [Altericroceibacterium indicum]